MCLKASRRKNPRSARQHPSGRLAGARWRPLCRFDVHGLTAYPLSAASARVRIGDFRPFLREQNVELTHHPALTDAEYAVLKSDANPLRKAAILARSALRAAREQRTDSLLMVQRLLLLTPLPGIDPPRRVDVYDIDDALFVGSPAEANKRFQWVKQERRRAVSTMRRARLGDRGQHLSSPITHGRSISASK